jgi:hypothetical protein
MLRDTWIEVVTGIMVIALSVVIGVDIITHENNMLTGCYSNTTLFTEYCYCLGGPNVHFFDGGCRIGDVIFYEKDYSKSSDSLYHYLSKSL